MTKIEVESTLHAERIRGALVESGEKALKQPLRNNRGQAVWAVYTPAVPDAVREILVDRALYRGALVGPMGDTRVFMGHAAVTEGDPSVYVDIEDLF